MRLADDVSPNEPWNGSEFRIDGDQLSIETDPNLTIDVRGRRMRE